MIFLVIKLILESGLLGQSQLFPPVLQIYSSCENSRSRSTQRVSLSCVVFSTLMVTNVSKRQTFDSSQALQEHERNRKGGAERCEVRFSRLSSIRVMYRCAGDRMVISPLVNIPFVSAPVSCQTSDFVGTSVPKTSRHSQ